MSNILKRAVQGIFGGLGLSIQETPSTRDMEPEFLRIFESVEKLTMTSVERAYGVFKAVEYLCRYEIPGDIVECGVWKGGSSMVAALALQAFGSRGERSLYLYDTYEGMAEPSSHDVDFRGRGAQGEWAKLQKDAGNSWCYASLDEVRRNLLSTGFPEDRLRFIKGKVEETIPREIPERIALLRLDTDWYESTRHELLHLFPRVARGGVLILDDYGHWKGAKEATDAYFRETKIPMLLSRLDYTGRMGIKQ